MWNIYLLSIIPLTIWSGTVVSAITLRCTSENDYYTRNCTFDGVQIEEVFADVSFSTGYHYNTPNNFKFINSKMIEIPKKLFEVYSSVQQLSVVACGIESVTRYTFERASQLLILNMSSNKLNELQNYVFAGANRLTVLDLSKNNISNIEEKAFSNLAMLQSLFMSSNRLKHLKDSTFVSLTGIRKLSLSRNELEVLQPDLFAANSLLSMLFIQNNQLVLLDKDLFKNVTGMDYLWLANNSLTSLEFNKLNVKRLNVMNNKLKLLKINAGVVELYAGSNNITNIDIENASSLQLSTLDLSWNKLHTLDALKNVSSLKFLDLSHNSIGPLNLTTFAKFTELQDLNLEDTGISNLQHGTFSQQRSLKRLDISYNNLNRIDLDIFTSSHQMEEIFVEGNRLKDLNYEEINKIFPVLSKISIADNNWNCSYLTKMIRSMNSLSIVVGGFKSESLTADQTNVKGIYCSDDKNPIKSWNETAKHLDKYLNDSTPLVVDTGEIREIMQNAIDDVSQFKEQRSLLINKSEQLEGEIYDLTKKLIALENDIYVVKKSILDVKMSQLANATNETAFVSNDLRKMMQELNDLTLAKLKHTEENFDFKIYQQSFKYDKLKESIEENAGKLLVLKKQFSTDASFGHYPLQQELKTSSASAASGSSQVIMIFVLIILVALLVIVLVAVYRNRFAFGARRSARFSTSSTLATMVDNEI
ncbi:toll-like receptor 3 [Sabethes cyaneus]|uniref:toll-like receptor 3 n=1 Tax=Sabethes cyaneus TaxID=53552 RepID=UPI00237D7236|nr:toll-like receptor 3 [Sabethes cyaneus]